MACLFGMLLIWWVLLGVGLVIFILRLFSRKNDGGSIVVDEADKQPAGDNISTNRELAQKMRRDNCRDGEVWLRSVRKNVEVGQWPMFVQIARTREDGTVRAHSKEVWRGNGSVRRSLSIMAGSVRWIA